MKPTINATEFGSITIDGEKYQNDVVIRLSGDVKKRKKKLSKAIYGTSHKVSLDEAKDIYEQGAELLLIGAGQYGMVELTEEAGEFFKKKGCRVEMLPTAEAISVWNTTAGDVIGMFHVTC